MAVDSEILILCTSKDNEPLNEGDKGWGSSFQQFLDLMLYQVLGEKASVRLVTENDDISSTELKKADILIPILSSHFNDTGKCLDAIEEYHSNLKKGKAANHLFKVLKSPLRTEEQPSKLRDLLGYELYYVDEETGDNQEIVDFFGPDAEKNYWMKLVDLAYDIHESLYDLTGSTDEKDVKPLFSRKSVYLAETSHDLVIQRNIIRRELQRHGYKVLPDHTLPNTLEELEETIKTELAECDMSIHLIGSSYGDIPTGSERSIVDLQNKIASDVSGSNGSSKDLSRLIWISPDLKNTSERQKTFIENIKRDISSLEGAEILQTPLEDFKNIIREELIEVSAEKKFNIGDKGVTEDKSGKSVYVVYDLIDKKEVTPLIKFVEKMGFEVIHPAFEGELLDLRQQHIQNLVNFDLSVIFYGKVNLQWVRMKLLDLLKAPGFGRKKPILGRAIISGKDITIDNKVFDSYDVEIIDGNEKLPLDDIKEFFETKK